MLFAALIWFGCLIATPMIAAGKGQSGCGWFILAFLFGPLALLVAVVLPSRPDYVEQLSLDRGELRTCPQCAESVRVAAIKCRYCGAQLDKAV